MKAETKIKLSQMGFTTIEINAIECLPDLINEVSDLKKEVEELKKAKRDEERRKKVEEKEENC